MREGEDSIDPKELGVKEEIGRSDTKPKPEGSEASDKTEKDLGKLDRIFGELLDKVKSAPEAEREALNILVGHLQRKAEHLATIEGMQHLAQTKQEMLKLWQDLETATAGKPELRVGIQDWGQKFIEQKAIHRELVENIITDVSDKVDRVELLQSEIALASGRIGGKVMGGAELSLPEEKADMTAFGKSLIDPETGLLTGFDLEAAKRYGNQLDSRISGLAQDSGDFDLAFGLVGSKNEKAAANKEDAERGLEGLREKVQEYKKLVNELGVAARAIKKARAESFDELFNAPIPEGKMNQAA